MKLLYKDYELPSIFLYENGYLTHTNDYDDKKTTNDNVTYVKAEDNHGYFFEADVLSKINDNKDNIFDFN